MSKSADKNVHSKFYGASNQGNVRLEHAASGQCKTTGKHPDEPIHLKNMFLFAWEMEEMFGLRGIRYRENVFKMFQKIKYQAMAKCQGHFFKC